jgi:hypothetical protein
MNWQLPLAVIFVASASIYLARRTWRTWTKRQGCGTGCACGDSTGNKPNVKANVTIVPVDQLRVRGRNSRS